MNGYGLSIETSAVERKTDFRGLFHIVYLLLFCLIQTAGIAAADPVVITTNTTISATDTSYDNQTITVDACTVTINGVHQFESLTLINGAKVTHSANIDSQVNILDLGINNNVTIDTTSSLDANGLGYASDQGEGRGIAGDYGASGGGHGGNGGKGGGDGSLEGGISYDSITNPSQIGSGGAKAPHFNINGGAGGGGVRLNIGGRLENSGIISANGNSGATINTSASGGGSGGFIHLTVGELSGNGMISTNGGNGGNTSYGGGAAGGRIAVYYNSNNYTGVISSFGGSGKQFGAAGSIYLKSNMSSEDQVIYDNGGNAGASTSISGFVPKMMIRNQAAVSIDGEVTTDSCTISNNGVLTHSPNSTDQNYIIEMMITGDMTIETGGRIDVNGLGYVSDQGDGKGVSGDYGASGAGHGGNGGKGGADASLAGGGCYDSIENPSQIGSGGATAPHYSLKGGAGGGGIRLSVGGRLENNGVFQANGYSGVANSGNTSASGGGSGGFIHLSIGELAGNGTICANGGNGGNTSYGGGGSGGRIAVYFITNSYTGVISSYGGSGKQFGAAGSIYLKSNTSSEEQVIYDNGGNAGASTNISGILPDIIIRNNAVVAADEEVTADTCTILNNGVLTHTPNSADQINIIDILVTGDMTIETGGMIDVGGRGYASAQGPGKGTTSTGGAGGAGHGGNGGNGTGGAGGASYDSVENPSQIGSGGGKSTSTNTNGGAGGGGIKLNVGGQLLNSGTIQAIGYNGGLSTSYSGGGSGGFIYLTVGELVGSGFIKANGGSAGNSSYGGGGAGGRIAIYYHATRPALTYNMANITVTGGTGKNNGQEGTIYIAEVANPVITTNGGRDFSTNIADLTLVGTCLADAHTILVNDSTAGVIHTSGDPSWSYTCTLTEGANQFAVVAENALGVRSGAATITVTMNTTPPGAPEITTNAGGDFTVQNSLVQLQGACTADAASILVNGSPAGVTYTPGAVTWTYSGELVPGDNLFSVKAMNAVGLESPADTITVTFQNNIPAQPQNQAPADGDASVGWQVILQASAFSDADGDTHSATQWQIREQGGTYDNPVFDQTTGASLTQIQTAQGVLDWTTGYAWRVRYKDSRGSWSVYSAETTFTTIADNLPPEDVTGLTVTESTMNSLTVAWNHSADSAGDLAAYLVYVNDEYIDQVLANENGFTMAGLDPATGYVIKVTAQDYGTNESNGVSINAATLLANPLNLTARTGSTRVTLTWDPATPAELVSHYAVYRSTASFSSVEGVTPVAPNVSGTTASITGLTTGTEYYFAVTTVNISGGQDLAVTPIQATPTQNLIAHYTMDSITGNQLHDETGEHPGVIQGTPGSVTGYDGAALDLNGATDWIASDSLTQDIKTGDDLTLTMWFNTAATKAGDGNNILFSANSGTKGDLFRVGTGNSGGIFHSVNASDGEYGSGFNNGAWHHLALIQQATGAFRIYVDNTLIQTGSKAAVSWNNAVFQSFGQEWDAAGPSDFFDGMIDDVRVYNYALSAGEIADLYVDQLPPELYETIPADGSMAAAPPEIRITLLDRNGAVNHDATAATIVVTNGVGQPVAGSLGGSGSVFVFTPDVPFGEDTYHVTLTAADMAGNTQEYTFSFTVDNQAPDGPVITGGVVYSGVIQPAPAVNHSNTSTVTLTGTRMPDTAVWINGSPAVPPGSGDWSANLTLSEGDNILSVTLTDLAGNESPTVTVNVQVDSTVPTVGVMVPANDSRINQRPAVITVEVLETGSGIDLAGSTLTVRDSSMAGVDGDWQANGGQLIFTPQNDLVDSVYIVTLQLRDLSGNQGALIQYQFTLDTIAPPAPVINPVTSPAHNTSQTISGTREAYAAIVMNGAQVVGNTATTAFQHTVTLVSGDNHFTFVAVDRAGNQSPPVTVTIVYDDVPPLAVTTLTVDPTGDGAQVTLNWTGYNEAEHGDIALYRIYRSNAGFNAVSDPGVELLNTVTAGVFTYAVSGLTRNTAYYFAVVAVDQSGNFIPGVTAVAATPQDTQAPDEVKNLSVISDENRLVFSWQPSLANDLAGFKIYLDGASEPAVTLNADVLSYERTGLAPSGAYPFRITATDGTNESTGVSLTGYTYLDNPAGLTATPYSGKVTLSWNAVTPSAHVKHYAVYVKPNTDFGGTVSGAPALTTTGLTTQVAGLTNGVPYFFAVTAVNLSNGERKTVTSVSATPAADSQGPEPANLMAGAGALVQGMTLTQSLTVSLTASDPAGVSRAEFYIDGVLLRTDYTGPDYTCYLDLTLLGDGAHTLTIKVFDTLGNVTTSDYGFSVALAPPPAPVITQPATGITVNQPALSVSGQAEKLTTVQLFQNDAAVGSPLSVDSQGNFSGSVTLVEGLNKLEAAAINRAGTGSKSAPVNVTLNTAVPMPPASLSAETRTGGTIRLSWPASASTGVTGYNLYRATEPFTTKAAAVKVNANLITATQSDNLPPSDGTWHYRVTSVNTAANESELSAPVEARSDRVGPKAVSIVYSATGNVGTNGAMAPGRVNVVLTVDEPLLTLPFLSIAPEGGMPISIELAKEDDLTFTGFFDITESTTTARAWANFSARDAAGNRGTEIVSGNSILIDTDGPAVSRLVVTPMAPIKNDAAAPVAIQATLGLNEKSKAGSPIVLGYLLPSQGSEPVTITGLTKIDTVSGDAETWQADFVLPATAGQAGPETLSFAYTGLDDLDNISHEIPVVNQFQVYQGNLPPLAAPTGLTAEAMPGGVALLSWKAVTNAVGYQVYRKAPGEAQLSSFARVNSGLEYSDNTTEDGVYTYAVASIRSDNGEESESGLSSPVTVTADSQAPEAPTNLLLDLIPQGVRARWTASVAPEPVTYAFYRAAAETTPPADATLIQEGFTQTSWIDFHPASAAHWYFITAVDAVGNESAPCAPRYLDFALLPVSGITVTQQDYTLPVVTWTHPSSANIDGYNMYLGPVSQGVKLNSNLLTSPTYVDIGYSGDTRTYTLVARNDNQDSLARSVTLPKIKAGLPSGVRIKRGLMNRLEYQVTNSSSADVTGVTLKVNLNSRNHLSETFSVAAGETRVVPVVVAGYSELPDVAEMTTTMEIIPDTGEIVRIIRSGEIEVEDGSLILQIFNEEFTRGGVGKVGFTLQNTGDEEIEVVLAKSSGTKPSDQTTFKLLDADGNVIASQPFKQAVGDMLVNLSNGNTVARIPAGNTFTSELFNMTVPANAPDQVTVQLGVSTIYHHQGRTDQISMSGLSTTYNVYLIDTSYYGEVDSITPAISAGDQDIVITGRAMERNTNAPLGGVPLKLVVTVKGFERTYQVYTEADGGFAYAFTPLSGEAGVYTVRVVHPDLTDRPVHGTFTIGRTSVSPTTINLGLSRNYQKSINITVKTSEGNALTNARLACDLSDQPGGVLAQGVTVALGAARDIPSAGSANLNFTISADNSAAETAVVILKVLSGGEPTVHATVRINVRVYDAKPVLYFTPNHVQTGVVWDDTVVESVTLQNNGAGDMNDVTVSLRNQDGSPAPDWVYLNSAEDQGVLAVGQSKKIDIAFSPKEATTPQGDYTFLLRVTSSNHATRDIYLTVTVTQSGQGGALFKLSDIYTGTLDQNNQPIPGLAGAKIKLQNELVATQVFDKTSENPSGEALFENLPAGRYRYRITAPNHSEATGRVWIKPGVTATQEVFLDYNLVTVEWEVNEITIQDKYEITLNTTFVTDVPAAVVVVKPASITLPKMKAGDVLNGELTLTNYGLVRADNLRFGLPANDSNFKYEIIGGLPDSLAAKQVLTVPYRVTCLSPIEPESATGGGCPSYRRCGRIVYEFCCANGRNTETETTYCATYAPPVSSCGGSPPSVGGGGGGTVCDDCNSGGTISGLKSKPTPPSQKMKGAENGCYPRIKRRKCWCEPCQAEVTCKDVLEPGGSYANTLLRKYRREDHDLSVKVPGGVIDLKRIYQDYNWNLDPFSMNTATGVSGITKYYYCVGGFSMVTALIQNGVPYNLPANSFAIRTEYAIDGSVVSREIKYFNGSEKPIFVDADGNKISEVDSGYQFEDANGNTVSYDKNGRVGSLSNKSGVLGKAIYDLDDGRLIGIADRYDNQVVWFEYNENDQVSAVRDSENRRVEYSYNADGLLEVVTDVLGNETRYDYTLIGNESTELEPNTYHLGFTHRANPDNIVNHNGSACASSTPDDDPGDMIYMPVERQIYAINKVTDQENRVKNIQYNEFGDIVSMQDAKGAKSFSYNYDSKKKEYYASITSSSGKVKEVWYDSSGRTKRVDINGKTIKKMKVDGRTISLTDENGYVTVYKYDEWARLTSTVNPDGTVVSSEYNKQINRIIKQTDESGVVTEYEYNSAKLLERKIETSGTANERITEYTYDGDGNLLTVKQLGNADTPEALTTMTYDSAGNLAMITDAEGNITQFTAYDNMGNVLTKIDPRGKEWTYTYDAAGHMLTAADPEDNVTQFFYDKVGNKVREVDAEGKEKSFTYDSNDNLIEATDAVGKKTLFTYNSDNKLIRQTDPTGRVMQYQYDNEGRLFRTMDGNGNQINMQYAGDGSGCSSCTGAAGSQVAKTIFPTFEQSYAYDRRGRKTVESDITGSEILTTRFAYDPVGLLTKKTDKEGKITAYAYDNLRRLTAVTDPLDGVTEYTYDSRDNLISLKDAKGQVTTFEYDKNNRLTKEIRPMNQATNYAYDDAGNLIRKIDAKNQKTEYVYNDIGQLTDILYYESGGSAPIKTVTFTYDKVGNLISYDDGVTSALYDYDDNYRKISETVNYGPFGLGNTMTYYDNGLKKSFTGPDGIEYTYRYDAANQFTSMEIPGMGSVTVNEYTWNRPKSMTLPGGTTRTFSYDPLMRIKELRVEDPGYNTLLSYHYNYDKMDNITEKITEHGNYDYGYDKLYRLTSSDNPIGISDDTFTYDNVGNRLTSADTVGPWNYNQNNELNSYDDVTYEYDANGNMTRKTAAGVVTSYVYNTEDRLTQVWSGEVTIGTLIASYYYDPYGRRLWKDVGSRTYFHYSNEGLIGEYDGSGVEIKTYGYRPDSTWTTDPLFMKVGSEYYFYHNDHLGTPQKMTTISGAVVWSAKYSSFGKAEIDPASTVVNNLRFPGQYYDNESGLHYNLNRYYDINDGRYTRVDPIGFHGGDTNLYLYLWANPINWIDPLGLEAQVCVKGNKVTITIEIKYSGEGGTKEVTEKFKKGIEKEWSGKFGEYDVETKVIHGSANQIYVPLGNGRANVNKVGGNKGTWPSERPGWTAAHEAGHLMGLEDMYDYKTGKPKDGWEKDIMAVHDGKACEADIKKICEVNK